MAPLEGRSGHTAVPWKRGILIFGGEKTFNKALRMRDCFSDIKYLGFSPFEWRSIRVLGDVVEGRRNHSACLLSKYMIVHGGINNYGKLLSELLSFNLETLKWDDIEANKEIPLCFSKMIPVFKAETKLFSLYSPFEYRKDRRTRKVKEEGIYIFGGKGKDGNCTNDLWVITVGEKPLRWTTPALKGMPPSPRYHHSMDVFEDLDILVIFGGRVDDNPFGDKLSGFILSDLHILSLETLEWCSVSSFGIPNPRRFNHSTCRIGSQLVIFGGIDFGEKVNSDLILIEFDQKATRKLYNEHDGKRKFNREESPKSSKHSFAIENVESPKRSSSRMMSFLPIPRKSKEIEALKNCVRKISLLSSWKKSASQVRI